MLLLPLSFSLLVSISFQSKIVSSLLEIDATCRRNAINFSVSIGIFYILLRSLVESDPRVIEKYYRGLLIIIVAEFLLTNRRNFDGKIVAIFLKIFGAKRAICLGEGYRKRWKVGSLSGSHVLRHPSAE